MFNFRKIASVLSSAVMLSSTVALAAAASYPDPFVKNGAADVAVVYGSTAATTDLVAVTDITANLQAKLAAQTASGSTTTGGSISGEATPLFTGGTKLYINDSLNSVKNIVTKSDLPTTLEDDSFSGNVDTTYSQTIVLGANPMISFGKQPSSSDDPTLALTFSTSTSTPIYNATVTFNKAVNFTDADSKGGDLTLFGQKFTVASSTDTTDLVLLKTAEKVSLSSDDPSSEVTINGKKYTIDLVSASDTSATVKVTDESGSSETKEVNENASKKINGITVAVTNADENNLKFTASVIAGAEKVTLTSGSAVATGEDDTIVDGTRVTFTGGTTAMTKLEVSVSAQSSDMDALKPGDMFSDPVFGSFMIDYAGLNIADDSSAREDIVVSSNGDDKGQVKFTDYKGNTQTVTFVKNWTSSPGMVLQHDDDSHNVTVAEGEAIHYQDYVVVGNEDEGALLKLSSVTNGTTGTNSDKVEFTDVFSADTYKTVWTEDGTGTLTVGGKSYGVTLSGASGIASEAYTVRLNYPDSTGSNTMIVYPTIQTSKGAKIAFYTPLKNQSISTWDGTNTLVGGGIMMPDGNDYGTTATFTWGGALGNFTIGGSGSGALNTTNTASSVALTMGKLTFNLTGTGTENRTNIYLVAPSGGSPSSGNIDQPALIIWEEKDDNNDYQAMVVTLEAGATSDDGIGVDDVIRTWGADGSSFESTRASDSKLTDEIDLWGSKILLDASDSDQKTATISYPDEQIYNEIYLGENSAEITAGTVTSGTVKELGNVVVKDSEVSSVSSKNLVVVGGSCVNSVAASLLGLPAASCGSAWETKTGVGAGSFLIQSFDRGSGKVATLVAGYNAGDTTNAAKALTTQSIDTSAGKKYTGTSSTSVSLVTQSA